MTSNLKSVTRKGEVRGRDFHPEDGTGIWEAWLWFRYLNSFVVSNFLLYDFHFDFLLPPERAGQGYSYGNVSGNYADYDQYYSVSRNYSGGMGGPPVGGAHHHHPSTYSYSSDRPNSPLSPSDRSDSPSTRPLNSGSQHKHHTQHDPKFLCYNTFLLSVFPR